MIWIGRQVCLGFFRPHLRLTDHGGPWVHYSLLADGRALQLEWEEPFSATYNTYKMPTTLSIRQYETQNITKESALMFHILLLTLKVLAVCHTVRATETRLLASYTAGCSSNT